jgi:sporulation protein YlmC with PRC-barrel domain
LIRTDDGKLQAVIVETEAKGELVAIPFDSIQGNIQGDDIQLQTTMDKINKAPRVKQEELNTLSQPAVIEEVQQYWIPLGQTQQQPQTKQEDVRRTTPEKGLETEAIDETADAESTDPTRATGQPKAGEDLASGETGSPGEQPKGGELGTQPQPRQPQQGATAAEPEAFLFLSEHAFRFLEPEVTIANAIEGMDVYSSDGQPIGEVEDIVLDLDHGYVAYTLVGRGGFIGMGKNFFAVPIQAMEYTDAGRLQVNVGARTLKNMRGYVSDDVPRFVTVKDLERVYKQFKAQPY